MKKQGLHPLLFATIIFFIFLLVLFLGRLSSFQANSLSSPHFQAPKNPKENAAYNAAVCIDGKININTASQEELMLLPGIGETLSQRIIAYRDNNGNFSSIEELLNIKGIGKTSLDKLSEYITLGG